MATTVQVPERKQIQDEDEHRAFWDGIAHAFIPGSELRVPEGLTLHSEACLLYTSPSPRDRS